MLNRKDIKSLLNEAALSPDEYWVTSGAAMVLHGFREQTRDIDLGCTSRLADELESQGYHTELLGDGSRKIVFSEAIELFENWLEDRVVMLDGLPVVSVNGMIKMKEKLGREKDLEDIELIKRQIGELTD